MATTGDTAPKIQTVTFSSATTPPTVASSTQLTCLAPGPQQAVANNNDAPTQFVRLVGTCNTAAATGELMFFLADEDSAASSNAGLGKMGVVIVNWAATTVRQSHSTAAGDYVCRFSIEDGTGADTGRDYVDLFSFAGPSKLFPKWYIGATVISAGTVTVHMLPGRALS